MSESRKMARRRAHSVSKCLFKIAAEYRNHMAKSKCSSDEAWDYVVRNMSHKNLRIVNFNPDEFKELSNYKHLLNLAQSALFERAMMSVKLGSACAREEQT